VPVGVPDRLRHHRTTPTGPTPNRVNIAPGGQQVTRQQVGAKVVLTANTETFPPRSTQDAQTDRAVAIPLGTTNVRQRTAVGRLPLGGHHGPTNRSQGATQTNSADTPRIRVQQRTLGQDQIGRVSGTTRRAVGLLAHRRQKKPADGGGQVVRQGKVPQSVQGESPRRGRANTRNAEPEDVEPQALTRKRRRGHRHRNPTKTAAIVFLSRTGTNTHIHRRQTNRNLKPKRLLFLPPRPFK
jgi:hypothetical protein